MGRWDRAIAWSRMKKRCANFTTDIPTMLKRRPFTPWRYWRLATQHRPTRRWPINCRRLGILEKLWKKNPQHPGVAHYLIHSYDYPALATRGLAAARSYGSIAPWVPHALHMPSHIFTRLGMWEESIAANRSSADASRAYAAMRHRDATEAEELHALDYMAYSYLQEAEDAKAKEIVDFAATVRKTNPELEFSAAYALAAIPSRYALERNAWADAAALRVPGLPHWSSFPFMEALIEYAHALGRAHTGDLDGARKAMDRMRQLRDATADPKFDYFKRHLDLQMQAASAWVAYGEDKKEEAVDLLRRTADAEDILGKHPVSPGALVPAREQLGDLLLKLDRPKEAQQEFEAALKIYPGRFRGLYGAAQAAEQIGEKEKARHYYAKLTEQTAKAGDSRSELAQLREYRPAESPTEPAQVIWGAHAPSRADFGAHAEIAEKVRDGGAPSPAREGACAPQNQNSSG